MDMEPEVVTRRAGAGMKHRAVRGVVRCTAMVQLVLIAACKDSHPVEIQLPPPPVAPYSWKTATFQEQRIDPDSILLALRELRAKPYVESFVLVRNGFLVKETYSTLSEEYTNASIASVTKSFLSPLVGIALREGYLDSLGQRLLDFFPEYVTLSTDPRKLNITLEHLLTMRAGFDYAEDQDHSSLFNQNTNWMREAINLPLRENPGMSFNYASIHQHLLSGVLTRAARMQTFDIAQRFLLKPLGISVLSWPKDPQGYYFGGSGMVLYPRDMARLGYLYVNGGRVDSQSVVPAEWVRTSLQPHDTQTRTWGALTNVQYGYLWWRARWRTDDVFLAVGFGGQFIIGVPRTGLVIVITSNVDCTQSEADTRHFDILSVVTNHIFTAVRE